VWHDLGTQNKSKPVDTVSSARWGAEAQGPQVTDPLIAPGFLLNMRVPDDPKLNGDFRVDFDGNLQLPYDMTVNTMGMTLSSLEKKLTELYRPYFKTSSMVKLHVKERRYWVDVRGLVVKPGRYLVDQNSSLDELIAAAGGLSKESMPRFVRIQKGQRMQVLDLDQYLSKGEERPQIVAWLGGEQVFFQKDLSDIAQKSTSTYYPLPIYVLGEVRKPGEYSAKSGYDFLDFFTQANGFTESADLNRIEVIRRTEGRLQVYEFSWDNLGRAPAPHEGDVVLVHADKETRAERRITIFSSVLAALAGVATAVVLAREL
jgi:protein involved in polysaccharide export with SLBB domain